MDTIQWLLVVALVVNLGFIIWSWRNSLRLIRELAHNHNFTDSSRAFADHVVYTRTGLNTIYVGITIVTAFLAFTGLNIEKNLKEVAIQAIREDLKIDMNEVRTTVEKLKDISRKDLPAVDSIVTRAKSIDINALILKREEMNNGHTVTVELYDKAIRDVTELRTKLKAQTDYMFKVLEDEWYRNSGRRLYVARGIKIQPHKTTYSFREMGLPYLFLDNPAVMIVPSYADSSGHWIFAHSVKSSNEDIIVQPGNEEWLGDIWVLGRIGINPRLRDIVK